MKKFTYVIHNGFESTEIEADSVGIRLENGVEIELTYRKSDDEISLDCSFGALKICPRATNVVRIEIEK